MTWAPPITQISQMLVSLLTVCWAIHWKWYALRNFFYGKCTRAINMYVGYPENIRPFWVSWEPVAWPWCNLAASQRRPYCASVNSHSPLRPVSRQWDTVDWAYILCDRHINNDRASASDNAPAHSTALVQISSAKNLITQVCQPPLSPNLAPCNF
jgi:hypothetical protein